MIAGAESLGSGPGPGRYAVLGHPVAHSLSPLMQRAAFAAAGLAATYEALEVRPEDLRAALDRLHREGYEGLNLTAPHKERARAALAGVTPEGARLGSVNTLKRDPSGWIGHATDGLGFEAWARELGLPVRGARVAVLGAGGAARSLAPYLAALRAASVTVVGRDAGRVASLLECGAASGGTTAWSAGSWSGPPRGERFDLLVRALTPPEPVEEEERWWAALPPGGMALDLNYGARAKASRRRAERGRLRFEDGLGLLLHQGALSFQYWTGREAPLTAMRRALEAAMA